MKKLKYLDKRDRKGGYLAYSIDMGCEIMRCYNMKYSTLLNIFILLSLFISIALAQQTTSQLSTPAQSVGSITLQVTAPIKHYNDTNTNVNVTKSVIPIGSRLKFVYDIETPKVDNFYFVLAIDGSGSIATDSEEEEAINYAVPIFINDTLKKYNKDTTIKNINISLLSWDNDVNFNFSNKYDRNSNETKLIPIRDAPSVLSKNQIFGPIDNKNHKYKPDLLSNTNLSVALKASLDLLNKTGDSAASYSRDSKFIIIVTGESEYDNCTDNLILAIKNKGYSIYAIEMRPKSYEPRSLLQHLRKITGDIDKNPYNMNKTITCQAPEGQLSGKLLEALNDALSRAMSEPVATDVILYDSFYNLTIPDKIASVKIKGRPDSYTQIEAISNNSNIALPLPYGLWAKNTTEIVLESDLALIDLPLSVGIDSKPMIFSPANGSKPSHLQFKWLKTHDEDFYLPSTTINIESASLTTTPEEQAIVETTSKSSRSGFGIMTLLRALWLHYYFLG
jgi:hypothetical protein